MSDVHVYVGVITDIFSVVLSHVTYLFGGCCFMLPDFVLFRESTIKENSSARLDSYIHFVLCSQLMDLTFFFFLSFIAETALILRTPQVASSNLPLSMARSGLNSKLAFPLCGLTVIFFSFLAFTADCFQLSDMYAYMQYLWFFELKLLIKNAKNDWGGGGRQG